ncbi:hypothetical protein HAX54_039039, partial [Datura stramonium]|nr:hypothetical protein [Datura stramonium]
TMEPKEMKMIETEKSQKRGRPRKPKDTSSASKASPARRFRAKEVELHGLTWFNTKKKAKYTPENWIEEGHLALEFVAIRD